MKKLRSFYMHLKHPHTIKRKWIYPLALGSTLSLSLLFLLTLTPLAGNRLYNYYTTAGTSVFIENKLRPIGISDAVRPVRFAYLISGSNHDGDMLRRTLLALYHPNNRYVVHLDAESSPEERLRLHEFVVNHPLFMKFGNVVMITKANLVTYRGPTMVANTLHAAAMLLRDGGDWDWFINLSASDYPLVTQDDLIYVFSTLARDVNFIDHTSNIGWKEFQRAKPVIVDPGLYMSEKSDVFWITQRRSVPTAFKLFTGSAWMVLSRQFVDFCIWGWDNLPRTVLMYYANFISSPEGYFHTVICNTKEFRNTTVNSDLHFIAWDNPPKQHPHYLTLQDMTRMIDSNAPFARKFHQDEPVLDRIDSELLFRGPDRIVPGGWCAGSRESGSDPCSVAGNLTRLDPTSGAQRLQKLVSSLLSEESFRPRQCR
ncbi:putative glycosyl transferase, family 14 [Helianthus annuus]|uniref:Glycosyl transferase, family 14 n=1 Tax=Helianthus annuus TaxID=4232 RepID=A0A251TZA3_HELAN|nr:beta-glucuronosyltransferase GlcAT14B [Helianthus annuus]XP_035833668.1 beta-glucuronosyltransferase GlcAT14B [Helianthus annuus]KAF5792084.1 putative glycosyl transferase, family 14 [Helianthus annuus]KAJ0535681.1 putative glycosyl transferase, family 14 [Helianthus annuus]KAJ0543469.1 putative glycosyl transferase, family 14, beta-glucuronosyltransferase GlcAT14A/B/C [Helianthus annuus]KAJ0629326.1 putative glycosyl transferase, family 14 [Helianthus annuus]KAJ0889542.1 putative glycosyl